MSVLPKPPESEPGLLPVKIPEHGAELPSASTVTQACPKSGAQLASDTQDFLTAANQAAQKHGLRIKAVRTELGWAVEQLANSTGIPCAAIYRYESGMYTAPLHALIVFSDYFGVSLDWLIAGRETGIVLERDAEQRLNRKAVV